MYSDPAKMDYCVGGSLTYADLFVFEMVTNYFPKDKHHKQLFERFPRIFRIQANVEKDKLIASYIKTYETEPHHIPCEI